MRDVDCEVRDMNYDNVAHRIDGGWASEAEINNFMNYDSSSLCRLSSLDIHVGILFVFNSLSAKPSAACARTTSRIWSETLASMQFLFLSSKGSRRMESIKELRKGYLSYTDHHHHHHHHHHHTHSSFSYTSSNFSFPP